MKQYKIVFSVHITHLDINFYHLYLQDWTEGSTLLGARKSLWIVRLVLKTPQSSSKWTVRTYICVGKGKQTHLSDLMWLWLWLPQGFTSLKVTAVLSLREKDFSSWIPVATDQSPNLQSAGHFRALYTELFFMQSCHGHFCISGLLWYPSRLWLCPVTCPSFCMHMKLGKCTWPEAAWEESKHISSLSNEKKNLL